jgi:hypothetical protein
MARKLPKSGSANAVALEPQKRDRNNWTFFHAG